MGRLAKRSMSGSLRGITLIELMITIAIIGILAAIVYPSYNSQVLKTRRAEAKILLNDAAQLMQRCYSDYYAYNNANCTDTFDPGWTSPNGYYRLTETGSTFSATGYTLRAVPTSTQDTLCGTFTLNQAQTPGMAAHSGVTGTVDQCW